MSIRPLTPRSNFSDVSPATAPILCDLNSAKRYDVNSAANSYALTLVDIFERAIEAIWRANGHRMAELRDFRAARDRRNPGPAGDLDQAVPEVDA
jgi:hypothetical protein